MNVMTPDGSLITCSEGVHRSRVELGLDRLVALAMSYSSDEGSLTVCSSHSSENYWNVVEPRFQPDRLDIGYNALQHATPYTRIGGYAQ